MIPRPRGGDEDRMAEIPITIRATTPADGEAVLRLCVALGGHEGRVPALTPERYRANGFGRDPAFAGFIAERAGTAIGYAICHRDYDTDRMERSVYLADIYVEKTARGEGLGRRPDGRGGAARRRLRRAHDVLEGAAGKPHRALLLRRARRPRAAGISLVPGARRALPGADATPPDAGTRTRRCDAGRRNGPWPR